MNTRKSSLLDDLRAMPGAFWVLFAGTAINRFGMFVFPFLTIVLARRDVPLEQIGLVLAGFGVGLLGATLAGGWFADQFGRKNTIACGTFAQAGAMMALYFFVDPVALLALTTLAGFAGGFYHPAANALVADLVPQEGRLTAFALLRLAGNGGFALGTAAGGLLVTFSPFWLFAGNALTTLAFGVLALAALPHGIRQAKGEARWMDAIRKLRGDGSFWALAFAQFGVAFVFAQYASAYALEVTSRGLSLKLGGWALSPEQIYGALIGWNGLLIMFLELPLTRLTRTMRTRRVMAAGYVLVGLGFASNVVDAGLGWLAAGMTLFTLGEMLVMPMVGAWISQIAPQNMRGRYMGALAASWAVGSVVGQNAGLRIFAINPDALWLVCAFVGLASAFFILRLGHSASGRPEADAKDESALDPLRDVSEPSA